MSDPRQRRTPGQLEHLLRLSPDPELAIELLVAARRGGQQAELERALDRVAAVFDDSDATLRALEHLVSQPDAARELVWRARDYPGPRVRAWFKARGIGWGRLRRSSYATGTPSQASIFYAGERCGWHRSWTRDGRLAEETAYRFGKRHGLSRTLQEGGFVLEQHFVDDRLDGEERRWDRHGNLRHRGLYVRGQRTGRWTWWDEGQQVIGERDFTGLTLAALEASVGELLPDRDALRQWIWSLEPPLPAGGEARLREALGGAPIGVYVRDERAEGWLHEGRRQGTWSLRAPEGWVWRRIEYVDGLEHGRWVEYRPDGTIEVEGRTDRGVVQGLWRRFAPRGRLLAEVEYRDDRPWRGWTLEQLADYRWVEIPILEGEPQWPEHLDEDSLPGYQANLPAPDVGLAHA